MRVTIGLLSANVIPLTLNQRIGLALFTLGISILAYFVQKGSSAKVSSFISSFSRYLRVESTVRTDRNREQLQAQIGSLGFLSKAAEVVGLVALIASCAALIQLFLEAIGEIERGG